MTKVARLWLDPSQTYGGRCPGMSRRDAQAFRRASPANLPVSYRLRSLTLRLVVLAAVPINELKALPWITRAEEGWPNHAQKRGVLQAAWQR